MGLFVAAKKEGINAGQPQRRAKRSPDQFAEGVGAKRLMARPL
jgi:hypothetical protein